jgi:hydrogenase expression/formation protein HypC
MCIGLPCKVLRVEGQLALVELGGVQKSVITDLVEGLKPGDWVLVHAGFAISIIDEEQARETLKLIDEFEENNAIH